MKKKMREAKQIGIIDIGAHSVRLDIFELGKNSQGVLLESLSRSVNLGRDVFRKGLVSGENITLLCSIVRDFAARLDEYGITGRYAIATSAVREARNRELILSRVRGSSGIEIEILEEQEEARLHFLNMREVLGAEGDFDRMSGVACILGTGSLLVIYFSGGRMMFCESLAAGTMRLYDELGDAGSRSEQINEILQSLDIRERLQESVGVGRKTPLSVIGIGAPFRFFMRFALKRPPGRIASLDSAQLEKAAARAGSMSAAKLAENLRISEEQAVGVPLCGALFEYFDAGFKCSEFICPEVTTRSAFLSEVLRRRHPGESDPFYPDVIASAGCIGRKYGADMAHAEAVAANALQIFDKLKSFYDFPPRSRLLLELAALLHDVGRFIDSRQHHKHSYYIILHSQMPGISAGERKVVGLTARYHRKSTPRDSHVEYSVLNAEDQVAVLKLAAILRVADALNRMHTESFSIESVRIRNGEFIIRTSREDFEFEKAYARIKGNLFVEVFGLEIKLLGPEVKS